MLLILLGLLVTVGWSLHVIELTQVMPAFTPMQYRVAVGFLLLGLAILLHNRMRTRAILGLLLCVLAGLNLGPSGFQMVALPNSVNAQAMAMNTAMSFFLMGSSLVLSGLPKTSSWKILRFALHCAAGIIALAALCGYLFHLPVAYNWNAQTPMVPHAAIGFLLASGAFIILFLKQHVDVLYRRHVALPAFVFIASSTFLILLWQAMHQENLVQVKAKFTKQSQLLSNKAKQDLSWRYRAAQRFFRNAPNDKVRWEGQAKQYLRELSGLFIIEKRFPGETRQPNILSWQGENWQKLTGIVTQCRQQTRSGLLGFIIHGNKNYVCYHDASDNQLIVFTLATVFANDVTSVLEANTGVTISNHDNQLYAAGTVETAAQPAQWRDTLSLSIYGQQLTFQRWANQAYINSHTSWIPNVFIIAGLLVSFLLSIILYMWKIVRQNNRLLTAQVKGRTQALVKPEKRVEEEQQARQLSERLFSENKKLYEEILDATTDGWWDWTLGTNDEYLSPKLKAVLGYRDDELPNTPESWQKLIFPEDLAKVYENFNQHIESKGKQPFYQEVRYCHKDGTVVWVVCRGQAIQDSDGEFRRMIGTHTDITKLKQTENRLSKKIFELDLVYNLTQIATGEMEFQTLLERSLELVAQAIGWSMADAYKWDVKKQCLVSADVWYFADADVGMAFKEKAEQSCFSFGIGFPGAAWKANEVLWIDDVTKDGCFKNHPIYSTKQNICSAVGVPITVNNKLVAVLEFFSTCPQMRDENLLRIFQVLRDQVGLALEKKAVEHKFTKLAHYDSLTSLPNRNYFQDMLQRCFHRAKRNHNLMALLFIDLDKFKDVNDTLGHQLGDKLLQRAGERINQSIRNFDFLARLGGDEFVIIMDWLDTSEKAGYLADRILEKLQPPIQIGEHSLTISASIGIAVYPFAGDTIDALLQHADIAMYQAKSKGRASYQYFTQSLEISHQRRVCIEQALRQALQHEEFHLVYQAIFSVSNQQPIGVEVLLRWEHAELGKITPDEFIPMAEENGCIHEIGLWVFEQACQQLAIWQKNASLLNLKMSINCSVLQLQKQGFLETITLIMDKYTIDPKNVIIELTETALMQHVKGMSQWLTNLTDIGLRLAIDDFGAGYSSLNYLQRLPISLLKIDRAFMQDIEVNREGKLIVKAIINLAKAMNIEVIAEGIETAGQLAIVQAYQCQYAQGYYLGRPLKRTAFEAEILKYAN